jgi:hypothetical protein
MLGILRNGMPTHLDRCLNFPSTPPPLHKKNAGKNMLGNVPSNSTIKKNKIGACLYEEKKEKKKKGLLSRRGPGCTVMLW